MPSQSPSVIATAQLSPTMGHEVMMPQALAIGTPPETVHGDAVMYKLSKRLWSIEIHRRLELQTRRVL